MRDKMKSFMYPLSIKIITKNFNDHTEIRSIILISKIEFKV